MLIIKQNNQANPANILTSVLKVFVLVVFLLVLVGVPGTVCHAQTDMKAETSAETVPVEQSDPPIVLTGDTIAEIETFVKGQMTTGKIPGMSVTIVSGNNVMYEKGFGVTNIETNAPVTVDTIFELASCSKAFTALAVLQLESKGLLALNDPVSKYIPWFEMKHRGKPQVITIAHLLYQSSGIPHYEALGKIPPSTADTALEDAVKEIAEECNLSFTPGEKHAYSTTNYDILGLIVSKISGQRFETYLRDNILVPLDLSETYLSRENAAEKLSTGHKLSFGEPVVYDAPMYRGNMPAGYVMSSAKDMAKWLKIQMGTMEIPSIYKALVKKSHITDPALPSSDYAAGWYVFNSLGLINHPGDNPNFSCYLVMDSKKKIGIAVLANSNSGFTTGTGKGIMEILHSMGSRNGGEGKSNSRNMRRAMMYDMNMYLDGMASKAIYGIGVFFILGLMLLSRTAVTIAAGKRKFTVKGIERLVGFLGGTFLLVIVAFLLSLLPYFLSKMSVPLGFALVWAPVTLSYAVYGLFLTVVFFYLFVMAALFFPKKTTLKALEESKKNE